MSDDEDNDCPLCLEEIDISDKYFKPCPCGYQVFWKLNPSCADSVGITSRKI